MLKTIVKINLTRPYMLAKVHENRTMELEDLQGQDISHIINGGKVNPYNIRV